MRYWPGCTTDPKWCKEFEAELKRVRAQPRRLTTHTEIIFGGIRLDPGTYEVKLLSREPEPDPQF